MFLLKKEFDLEDGSVLEVSLEKDGDVKTLYFFHKDAEDPLLRFEGQSLDALYAVIAAGYQLEKVV